MGRPMRPMPIQPIFCAFLVAMANSSRTAFMCAGFPITGGGDCNAFQPPCVPADDASPLTCPPATMPCAEDALLLTIPCRPHNGFVVSRHAAGHSAFRHRRKNHRRRGRPVVACAAQRLSVRRCRRPVGGGVASWTVSGAVLPAAGDRRGDIRAADGQAACCRITRFDTLLRLIAGFALAAIVGVGIGVLMGRSRRAEDYLLPLVSIGAPIPGLAYTPLFLLWFGPGNVPPCCWSPSSRRFRSSTTLDRREGRERNLGAVGASHGRRQSPHVPSRHSAGRAALHPHRAAARPGAGLAHPGGGGNARLRALGIGLADFRRAANFSTPMRCSPASR